MRHFTFGLSVALLMLSVATMAQITGETCIKTDGTEYVYDVALPDGISLINNSFSIYTWGGIEVVSVDSANNQIKIKSKQGTTKDEYFSKFGKGRIWISVNTAPCGIWYSFDVCKMFDMTNGNPYGYKIVSPTCISAGDTMTVAVSPIVTMAFPHSPMEQYKWSFPDSLIREVLFAAVDSSSITFVAGNIGIQETISVKLGKCNLNNTNNILTRRVYNAPNIPKIIGDECVQWGYDAYYSLTTNTQSDMAKYTWYVEGKRVFNDTTPSAVLNLNEYEEYKYADEIEIVVQANPINGNCFGMVADTIIVQKGLNKDIAYIDGVTCFEHEKINTLTIKGVSITGDVTWEFPEDWGYNNITISGAKGLDFQIPDTTFNLAGQIKAYAPNASCSDTLKFDFYIKPRNVEIIGQTKVEQGLQYTYSITNPEPNVKYKWTISTDVFMPFTSLEGNSITLLVVNTDNPNPTISVTPMGEDGCNGEKTSLKLKYPPKNLTYINVDKCININMPTENVTFTVNKYPGYTYKWTFSNDLGTFTNQETSDNFITGTVFGTEGTYTVKCLSVLNGEESSTAVEYTFEINDTYDLIIKESYNNFYQCEISGITNFSDTPPNIEVKIKDDGITVSENFLGLGVFIGVILNEKWKDSHTIEITYTFPATPNCSNRKLFKVGTIANVIPLSKSQANNNSKSEKQTGKNILKLNKDLFNLYPNPTNNFINIQLNDFNTQSPTDIEIYNMQGKLMYKNKITERETKIDITDFTPNNYLVMIKKDDKYEVKQVVKH